MNIAALKAFAPAVRRQLMEAVTRKLDFVLAAQTPDYLATFAPQVRALRELATADRSGLIERVAYTWFNRLTALRYLDARGWHPFRTRVLMPASAGEMLPEILKLARNGTLAADLKAHTDTARLDSLLDGHLPSSNPQGEVYRHLVLAACRFYHALMPSLFERLDDETELLLPDDLLTEQSVAQGFRTEITDDDCSEVEVIGWLYQFYISEKKDAVMARKSAVPTEDIPAVTQLFTPHWIVRYLVENSLGRLWLLSRPASQIRAQMPYYIEGETETDFLRITTPEEIRFIDPAVGSGHMLTYAFELLFFMYEEEGYAPSEIPRFILENNLHGLDIDPRAAQLASLALTLKAREKSSRFFRDEHLIEPHIAALRDIHFEHRELQEYIREADFGDLFNESILALLNQFEESTTFGSLIQPCISEQQISFVRSVVEAKDIGRNLFLQQTHIKVLLALQQAEMLSQRYHVVVANPPYMGFKQMNGTLRRIGETELKESARDLFSMFIQRNIRLRQTRGFVAMVTMDTWMYGDDHTDFRDWLYGTTSILTMAHLGPHAFDTIAGEVVQATAFVTTPTVQLDFTAIYARLVDEPSSSAKESALLGGENRFRATIRSFLNVPRRILAYQATEHTLEAFGSGQPLKNFAEAFTGLQTGDNPRFIRFWHEVAYSGIRFGCKNRTEALQSGSRWFPYVKGSEFRRWYGNNTRVLDWQSDGLEIRRHPSSTVRNSDYYFREGLAYNNIANSFSVRSVEAGYICDQKNSMFFSESEEHLTLALGLLNSPVVNPFLEILSPKDFNPGSLKIIPVLSGALNGLPIQSTVNELISISRTDWDSFESSWNFCDFPLLWPGLKGETLGTSWRNWEGQRVAAIRRMRELETENSRIFIEAYGLQGEVSPEVPEDEIALARPDARKDMVAFLSFAVGCMMGRYSVDCPGLILADGGDTITSFLAKVGKPPDELKFAPDQDGIIPVLDGEWFENDIVAQTRRFLRASFGEAVLQENARFIEESLGKELRKYFLTDFYKDHLQTYKKRPIYWLVQSPRKGFAVLLYLHRYTRDTMNVILNKYLREFQVKLRSHIAHLAGVQASESVSNRDKTAARKEADKLLKNLHDCEEWERETMLPLAQARIDLDLDDGVQSNYLKLGEALAPIPGLAAAEE